MRTYVIDTAATSFPITLSEAKLHLKVDINTDDTLITGLIEAATQISEEYTNRFFITTTIEQTCSNFLETQEIYKSDVIAVTHIKYYDTTNTLATWAVANYVVSEEFQPCKISLDDGKSYPEITSRVDAVKIKYTVGYGSAASDVPQAIKSAILLTIGNWYANRESIITGRTSTKLEQSAIWLLDTYKITVVR